MKIGNTNINKFYVGNNNVNRIYMGNTLKYDNSLWTLNDTTVFAWYDMNQGIIDAGAGKVSAWNDAMGSSLRNITQATSGSRPTITSDAVEFNGTSEFLSNSNAFMYGKTEGVHIIAIMSGDASTGTTQRGISEANSGNAIQNYSLLCKDNSPALNYDKTTQAIRNDSSTDIITFGGNAGASSAWDSSFKLIEHIDTTSQIKTAVNCVDGITPISYTRSGILDLNTFAIGALVRSTILQWMQMKIKSLVIVPATISTDHRQRVQGYLCHRYSLTSLLPGPHPYKTNPPTR